MTLNKIWFFPCLCLLLLGMAGAAHAWPWSTKRSDESETLLAPTYGGTDASLYSLSSEQPPKWRKRWEEVKKKAPYYAMRATLPLYSMTTSYAPWVVSGLVLGALLGGGEGFTSLIGGAIGGAVGGKIARSLKERGQGWMRAYLRSALKADVKEGVAIANALTTFKTCAQKHALIAGVEPRAFVQQTIDEIKKQH